MAVFYFDTSAIVKRYRREKGTELADDLMDNPREADRFYTSLLSPLEVTSAVTRLSNAGEITEKTVSEVLARFHTEIRERFRIWPIEEEIIAAAILLVRQQGIRSADAIHLATAVTISSLSQGSPTVFLSSDRKLIHAAKEKGLATIDPSEQNALERLAELRRSDR